MTCLEDSGTRVETKAMKRLIVLPFRVLRSDPETDFLAFSLPDAIAASLAGLSSLVVRSSLAAARFTGAVLDLREIAKEVDVDTVLTGTLLRAGTQLRLTTQLVEAPSGTLIWSKASQVEFERHLSVRGHAGERRGRVACAAVDRGRTASSSPMMRRLMRPRTTCTCERMKRARNSAGFQKRLACMSSASRWIPDTRPRGLV